MKGGLCMEFATQKFEALFGNLTVYVDIRTGDPWFLAKDVAKALDYVRKNGKVDTNHMTRLLEPDEKGTHIVGTLGGAQKAVLISESGLYHAIFMSRKPEANEFRKWVTSVVLPSVRKNGGYILGQEELDDESRAALEAEIKKLQNKVRYQTYRIGDLTNERDDALYEARRADEDARYWEEQYQKSAWN